MSKSCKWVVIEESVYSDLLRSLESGTGERGHKVEREELGEEVESGKKEKEAVVEDKVEAEVEEGEEEKEEEGQKEEVVEEEKKEDSFANLVIESLPPTYRQEGSRLLNQLHLSKDFLLGDKGEIYIHGKVVPEYSLEKLIRTLCIPFHKGKVPRVLQEFLKEQGLTKFRNHLVKLMPVWEKRYSWRESTMETRRGPVEDPKPSTPKRAKRGTHK